MISLERIKEEYNDFIENPLYSIGVSVSLQDLNNYYEWKSTNYPMLKQLFRR